MQAADDALAQATAGEEDAAMIEMGSSRTATQPAAAAEAKAEFHSEFEPQAVPSRNFQKMFVSIMRTHRKHRQKVVQP
jgi:hypothetical protein